MPFRSGSIPSLFPINELLQATLLGFHLAKAAKAALFLSCIGTAVYTIIYHIYIYIYIYSSIKSIYLPIYLCTYLYLFINGHYDISQNLDGLRLG